MLASTRWSKGNRQNQFIRDQIDAAAQSSSVQANLHLPKVRPAEAGRWFGSGTACCAAGVLRRSNEEPDA
jgi:hypothetical protein